MDADTFNATFNHVDNEWVADLVHLVNSTSVVTVAAQARLCARRQAVPNLLCRHGESYAVTCMLYSDKHTLAGALTGKR